MLSLVLYFAAFTSAKMFWNGGKLFMQDFINLKQSFWHISQKPFWFRAIFLELLSWDTHCKRVERLRMKSNRLYGCLAREMEMPKKECSF